MTVQRQGLFWDLYSKSYTLHEKSVPEPKHQLQYVWRVLCGLITWTETSLMKVNLLKVWAVTLGLFLVVVGVGGARFGNLQNVFWATVLMVLIIAWTCASCFAMVVTYIQLPSLLRKLPTWAVVLLGVSAFTLLYYLSTQTKTAR